MGLIRGGFVFLLGSLLFVALFAMNTVATLSSSLSYDKVNEALYPFLSGTGEIAGLPAEFTSNFNLTKVVTQESGRINTYCRLQNGSYSFSFEGLPVNISCQIAAAGPETIVNQTVNSITSGIYYQEYSCDFWDCFDKEELPFFLISQKAHDYWKSKFFLLLFVSFALATPMVLFMENRTSAPIILGILLTLSVLPILKLSELVSFVAGDQIVSYVMDIFFSNVGKVFWISFIIGLVLVALGIAFKIMGFDFMKKLMEGSREKPQIATNSQAQPKQNNQNKKKKK